MNRKPLNAFARNLTQRLPRRAAVGQLVAGAALGTAAVAGSLKPTRRVAAQDATPSPEGSAFIVLRRYQLLPDASMDELVRRVEEGFVPIISKIAGFREYLFVDAGEGAHLTISLFDDQSGAEASTRNAADWAAANVAQLIAGPPEVTEGWVRIHVTATSQSETV